MKAKQNMKVFRHEKKEKKLKILEIKIISAKTEKK